jgi:CHAD domain-containing protein
LRESLSDTNGFNLRSNKDCFRQIGELKGRLKAKRKQWEKKLIAEIERRHDKLEEAALQTEIVPPGMTGAGRVTVGYAGSAQIAEQFASVVQRFSSLDADNLHEFRKSIKKVRYMAEIFAAQDPAAGRQASAIRKMQSAIGEWHDWQAMAKREGEARGRREALAELLETLAREALEKALATCERQTAGLLKGSDEAHHGSNLAPKKSPLRDEPGSLATDLVRIA